MRQNRRKQVRNSELAGKKVLCYTGSMKNLVEDLKTGNFKHMYLLTGEEVYLRSQYKKKLQDALVSPDDRVNMKGNLRAGTD